VFLTGFLVPWVERVEVIVKVGLCEWNGKRRMWKEVVSLILFLFSHSFYVSSFSFPECQLDQGNQDVVLGDWSRHSCEDVFLDKIHANQSRMTIRFIVLFFLFINLIGPFMHGWYCVDENRSVFEVGAREHFHASSAGCPGHCSRCHDSVQE
jgi:hypothetical protein